MGDACRCGCSWQLHVPYGRGATRGSCTSCGSCTAYEPCRAGANSRETPGPADGGCICVPCTAPGRGSWPGAPGWPHCAACCYGTLVAEYDHACPVGDHAEMAVRQHGPAPEAAR